MRSIPTTATRSGKACRPPPLTQQLRHEAVRPPVRGTGCHDLDARETRGAQTLLRPGAPGRRGLGDLLPRRRKAAPAGSVAPPEAGRGARFRPAGLAVRGVLPG